MLKQIDLKALTTVTGGGRARTSSQFDNNALMDLVRDQINRSIQTQGR